MKRFGIFAAPQHRHPDGIDGIDILRPGFSMHQVDALPFLDFYGWKDKNHDCPD
jgi:hypothetical protein